MRVRVNLGMAVKELAEQRSPGPLNLRYEDNRLRYMNGVFYTNASNRQNNDLVGDVKKIELLRAAIRHLVYEYEIGKPSKMLAV